MLAAAHNISKMNPYDFVYNNLAVDVQPLSRSNRDYEYIMRYMNSSSYSGNQHKFVLDNIYTVNSSDNLNANKSNFDSIH